MKAKRIVIAEDDGGNRLAIGPVYTDASADQLRRQVDDYGWTVRGVIPLQSLAQFTTTRRGGLGAVTAGTAS